MRSSETVVRSGPNERYFEPPDGPTPETLRAAREGDTDAFSRIVRFYYPRCLRFAQRFVLSREDAEECVQDTFVRLHRALPRYEERQRFNAWLFRILANRCRSVRNRARWRVIQIAKLEVPSPTAHQAADSFGAVDALGRALDVLPSDQRSAFLLRHVEGFSYEQIAAIAGVTITAARMRVSRACTRLREAVTAAMA